MAVAAARREGSAVPARKQRLAAILHLAAVLAAKVTHVLEVVHRSPHAAELLGWGSRLATAAVEASDRRYAAWLRQVVDGAVLAGELELHRVGLSPRKVSDALLRLGHGAAYRSGSAEEHRRHLGELVELVVAGLRPPRR